MAWLWRKRIVQISTSNHSCGQFHLVSLICKEALVYILTWRLALHNLCILNWNPLSMTGQVFEIHMPSLDFKTPGNLPITLRVESNESPTLKLKWTFMVAFGFDETDGFFIYTFPGEASEFFVKADFDLHLDMLRYATPSLSCVCFDESCSTKAHVWGFTFSAQDSSTF
jgi:hypothetical protein